MFIELLPDILRYITTSSCLITLFFALSRPKYKIRVYVILAIVVVLFDAVVCTLFSLNDKLTEEVFYSIPFYVLLTCCLKWLFKDNILQWVFNCITVYIVHVIILFASFYLGRLMPLGGYGVMLFRVIFFGLFITFFYLYLRPLYLQVSESWGMFICPIIGIFVSYVYLLLSKGHAFESMLYNFEYYCLLTVLTVLVYTSIVCTIFMTKKKQALRDENQKRKANEDLLLKELSSYHEFVQIAKVTRHDIRHHNAVLSEYLISKDFESATQYLSEYTKDIDSSALTEFCKNPLANAVLRVYEKRIIDSGIEFVLEAEALGQVPFSIIETSTVLSNILENALEATEKCKVDKKFIHLRSSIKNNKLIVEVENSSDLNKTFKDGMPISTKEGGGNGLKSIKSVVDKYDGLLNLNQLNGVFILQLIVALK